MKPHSIKFAPSDWNTLKHLKTRFSFRSVGELINALCADFARENSEEWQGGATWGDSSRFKNKQDHSERTNHDE